MSRNKTIRLSRGWYSRRIRSTAQRAIPNDLSFIEDSNSNNFLFNISELAAANAINENKAMNLPVTFAQDGWVVQRMPGGNIEKITAIEAEAYRRNRKLTKGTVLHVKSPS